MTQPHVVVDVVRKPRAWPAEEPFGPCREPSPDEHYTTLHTGASKDELDLAMATWYGEAEDCLADCYACDLVQLAALRGRASGPRIVKAPLVAFGRGTVVGNQTSSF